MFLGSEERRYFGVAKRLERSVAFEVTARMIISTTLRLRPIKMPTFLGGLRGKLSGTRRKRANEKCQRDG